MAASRRTIAPDAYNIMFGHYHQFVVLFERAVSASVVALSHVCTFFAVDTYDARKRMRKQWVEGMRKMWVGVRVCVPWPADDTVYWGIVERVFPSGLLRVHLDERVGRDLSCYVTLHVTECYVG